MTVRMTHSAAETEAVGASLAATLQAGDVVALYGDLGMGKTAFVRGMASVMAPQAEVSSPTFALVHDYGGAPPLVHFDMYRVTTWDDVYATGLWDYIDAGAVTAVEWSEHIEAALPDHAIRVRLIRLSDSDRRIEITGSGMV